VFSFLFIKTFLSVLSHFHSHPYHFFPSNPKTFTHHVDLGDWWCDDILQQILHITGLLCRSATGGYDGCCSMTFSDMHFLFGQCSRSFPSPFVLQRPFHSLLRYHFSSLNWLWCLAIVGWWLSFLCLGFFGFGSDLKELDLSLFTLRRKEIMGYEFDLRLVLAFPCSRG